MHVELLIFVADELLVKKDTFVKKNKKFNHSRLNITTAKKGLVVSRMVQILVKNAFDKTMKLNLSSIIMRQNSQSVDADKTIHLLVRYYLRSLKYY